MHTSSFASSRAATADVEATARRGLGARVALVAPSTTLPGGQAVQAHALTHAFRAEGAAIELIAMNRGFPPGLRWLKRQAYARTLLNEALYVAELRRLRRADVVHIFSASYWSFLLGPVPAIALARRLGKRIVLHYHSGEAEDHLARWGRLVHPWLRRVDQIVVPSAYLKEIFARFGHDARVIPNMVDTRRFRYRERQPLRPRLLSNRNLEPHYRVDDTLDAFKALRARYPEATLTIAGTGSEEAVLRGKAAACGLGAVRFIGRVEPRDMPRLLDDADFFVNASVVDNQPVSILEAFAAGLPVVSTPTGDIRAMLGDGERGFVVAPRDPAGLAATVASLLEEPARALPVVRRARQEIERYTWPRVREEWVAVYGGPGDREVVVARP